MSTPCVDHFNTWALHKIENNNHPPCEFAPDMSSYLRNLNRTHAFVRKIHRGRKYEMQDTVLVVHKCPSPSPRLKPLALIPILTKSLVGLIHHLVGGYLPLYHSQAQAPLISRRALLKGIFLAACRSHLSSVFRVSKALSPHDLTLFFLILSLDDHFPIYCLSIRSFSSKIAFHYDLLEALSPLMEDPSRTRRALKIFERTLSPWGDISDYRDHVRAHPPEDQTFVSR
ncbi:hypothetical protein CIRG_09789 [Coccidioides immitis RMSCC 2394]|uniref:Uncharacterized protein n=1 Tax=Coccidioides immitis RMSCC 2394 TaxID=404692 RepID=A0A0J6YQW0_COCIT|nr:hypothetical protein CIRG_09789 [Coccidioides immitis RMSCC 2394]